jgi:hypothetical protein
VHITITADGQTALGASIFVNGTIKAIANEQGEAQLKNIQYGDTIQISYIGYKTERIVFSSQHKELNINLIPDIFAIGEISVSSTNDRHLFRKMMKRGLNVAILSQKTSFSIIDTLSYISIPDQIYRKTTGSFVYPLKGSVITVKNQQTKLLDSTSEEGKKYYLSKGDNLYENYKESPHCPIKGRSIECRDIENCFSVLYSLSNFNNNIRWIYIGKDSTKYYDQFYYYVPDGKWVHNWEKTKCYYGGIVYLNPDGIIEKVKKHRIALNFHEISHEAEMDCFYDKKYNEVIPYRVTLRDYFFDEGLNVILTKKACIEIYSRQAVAAGIITPQ